MEKVLGLKGLEKLLLALLVMRALSVLAACWSDFAHPHITRQADTMGVVFRYFSRWFIETESAYPLLPATLAAGDQYGLAPTEFPLIGVSLAPLFHVGSMELSVPLVRTFLIIAVLFLSYWNYRLWQNIAVSGFTKADSAVAALIVPIFSISGLFLGKFIPDPLAFILALIALGFAFQQRYVGAGLVGTIAVLLKPPVIVVFALLLLEKEPLRLRWKHLLWISCLFAVVLFYYVVGLGFIKSVSDVPHYFHTHFRNPIFSLIEGLSYPFRLFELLLEQIFPRYLFPVILVLSFVWSKNRRVVACLWTLLVYKLWLFWCSMVSMPLGTPTTLSASRLQPRSCLLMYC